MVVLWGVAILFVGIATCQQYGPPGYTPGLPIGTPGQNNDIIKANGYDASQPGQNYGTPEEGSQGRNFGFAQQSYDTTSQNYGTPEQGIGGASQNYGPPQQDYGGPNFGAQGSGNPGQNYGTPQSYGPPQGSGVSGGSRFKIIPANEFKIPEQHSNLIRYIVLKEFQIGPNGSATPLHMGLGRNNGSPELEITRVQMPSSAEMASAGGSSTSGENNGGEVSGGYGDGPSGSQPGGYADPAKPEDDDDDEDDYDDYDDDEGEEEEEQMKNKSVGDAVLPARGVDLSASPKSSTMTAMQAFMFSDPNSNSIEAQSRQGTTRNRVKVPGRRNRVQGRRNRNRNRQNRRRNRNRQNRNRSKSNSTSSASAVTSPATPASEGEVPMDELQMALRTLSTYFSSQAQQMRTQQSASGTTTGAVPSNMVSVPGTEASSYSNVPITSGGPYSASGSSSSSGGASGGYQGSGRPESNSLVPEAQVIDADMQPVTQTTFPAATYGPPPGSPGFRGNNAGGSFAEAITGPIQTAATFKTSVINTVANGLTAGIRGVAAATNSVTQSVSNVANTGSGSSVSDPAPVYGAPTFGSSGSISPLRQLVGLKGQAVRTVANTGKAAVGIVGTKGQLVVNQVGTVASTLTKGVAQALNNNNDAFQNVIRHIQSIFNSNANMKNNAYGTW